MPPQPVLGWRPACHSPATTPGVCSHQYLASSHPSSSARGPVTPPQVANTAVTYPEAFLLPPARSPPCHLTSAPLLLGPAPSRAWGLGPHETAAGALPSSTAVPIWGPALKCPQSLWNSEVPGTDPLSCGGYSLSTLAVCLSCVAVSVAPTFL